MQNPFRTILRFQNVSKFFFEKIIFFNVSTPILQRWETGSQKKLFFSAFFLVQNQFRLFYDFKFLKFFSKIIFFTVSTPYTAQVEKWSQQNNHFLMLFYSAKSISDHFTISNISSFFFQKFIFLLFWRPILHAKLNEKYWRSTLKSTQNM